MADSWTDREIELIAADYFSMLRKEISGQPFNKTEHRVQLLAHLDHRSGSSIEYKHRNISAVLAELELPFIDGYKPALNFQRGIFPQIVERAFFANTDLLTRLEQQAETAREKPIDLANILAALTEVPEPLTGKDTQEPPPRYNTPMKINYLEREARNSALGLNGESFVLAFEKARLIRAGKDILAAGIEHISLSDDRAGFDIKSYEADGTDRFIEVKTTRYSRYTPFFVSENERRTAIQLEANYQLYRVFSFEQKPRLFQLPGRFENQFTLEPQQYLAKL